MKFFIILIFIGAFFSAKTQTFSGSGTAPITSDDTWNCFDINVSGVGPLSKSFGLENICLTLTHEYTHVHDIKIITPNGDEFLLKESDFDMFTSGGNGSLINTCFNASSNSLANGTPPYSGGFASVDPLFDINEQGMNADGIWSICIKQDGWGFVDAAELTEWSLVFSNNPIIRIPTHQDCLGARPVCFEGDTFPEINLGNGAFVDINTSISSDPCYNFEEQNSAWYTYTVQSSGLVNFTITPLADDDYDWAVFDITDKSCADIATDPDLVIACNYTGLPNPNGPTGPNGGTSPLSEAPFFAEEGDVHVIYVSNYGTGFSLDSGYVINLEASTAGILDTLPPQMDTVYLAGCSSDSLILEFDEPILCNDISISDFVLTGPSGIVPITSILGEACLLNAPSERRFVLFTPDITELGQYTLSFSSSGGVIDNCGYLTDQTNSVDLTFTIDALSLTLDASSNSCYSNNDGTASVNVVSGNPPYTYAWDDPAGSSDPTIFGLTPGDYTVTVTDAATCEETATVTVLDKNYTLSNDTTICDGDCVDLTLNQTGGTDPITITWTSNGVDFDNGASQNYCPNINTTYTVRVQDADGCDNSETIDINVLTNVSANFTATPSNFTVCEGDTIKMRAIIANGLPPFEYIWGNDTTDQNSYNFTPDSSGVYTVKIVDRCPTDTLTRDFNFFVYETPDLDIYPDSISICFGDTAEIISQIATDVLSYTVKFGEGKGDLVTSDFDTLQHRYSQPGTYDLSLSIITEDGCFEDSTYVGYSQINEIPIAQFIASTNEPTDLNNYNCYISRTEGATAFNWIIDQDTIIDGFISECATHDRIGGCFDVTLVAFTNEGCRDTTIREFCLDEHFYVHIPTAFTPNGDGINDLFEIQAHGFVPNSFNFQVFSRKGDMVFESNDPNRKWDGTNTIRNNDKTVKTGVYVWKMSITDLEGNEVLRRGNLTVLQ